MASTSKSKAKETPPEPEIEDGAPQVDFEPADIPVADDPGRVQRITFEPDSQEESETGSSDPVAPEGLGEAEFVKLFVESFSIPQIMLGAGWAEFAVSDADRPGAEAAGKSIYELVRRFMPRLLMIPQADLLTHLMVAGGFLFVKYKVAMSIMRAANLPDAAADGEPDGQGSGLDYVKREAA